MKDAAPRVAVYARVSTLDQNPHIQLDELRKYAAARNLRITREYVDQTTGDASKKRKDQAFRELMADAGRRKFDCVLVWKFDRFARSLHALIDALDTFAALKVDFIASTQSIDTTLPMGRLLFQMIGAFAEFERGLIVERTRAGVANAQARGVRFGRRRDPLKEKKILRLRAQGKSLRVIAAAVKFSPAGVLKVINRSNDESAPMPAK